MARPKKIFNKASSDVIEQNHLLENPEGLSDEMPKIAVVKQIPKMERIIFRNDRDPGFPLEFHYHSKTHHLQKYKLFHGKEYTLPVEIVEHLDSRAIPIYAYRKGPDGHPEMYIASYKNQFTCKTIRNAA